MEFNENPDTMPIPQLPNDEEPADSGVYQGAGVGHKESPYANSPYYSYYEMPKTAPEPEPQPEPSPVSAEPPKPRAKKSGNQTGRRILAAILALVLVIGSCGVTAGLVNARWEEKTEAMEAAFEAQLDSLAAQMQQISASVSAHSVSGSPAATGDGLTPAQVYASNVNSVVSITSTVLVAGSGWGSQSYTAIGSGSGFIISQDGYIMTNYHVVEGATSVTVTTHLGEEYPATIVGGDSINDVALLKVDAKHLDPVEIGSSDALIVGDMVVAIGNPLGELTATQTVGYVSGKDRSISTDGSIINMIQTDAAINSGNSGGPLFNMKGQVVGITTAKYSGASSSGATIEGIGFAIPIDDVMSMIEDFKNYGYLKNQAYLGVTVLSLDASTANMYSLPTGSYVQEVVAGGSADRAGVQPKDIIIAIGEHTVDGNSTLTSVLRKFSAGDTTTITIYRGGQELTMEITFDEKPANLESGSTEPTQPGELPENGSYDDWSDSFFGD